jgi:hypothetical protein
VASNVFSIKLPTRENNYNTRLIARSYAVEAAQTGSLESASFSLASGGSYAGILPPDTAAFCHRVHSDLATNMVELSHDSCV